MQLLHRLADGLEMLRGYAAADDPQMRILLDIGVWSAYFGDAELAFAALERATRVNAQNALQFWLPSMVRCASCRASRPSCGKSVSSTTGDSTGTR